MAALRQSDNESGVTGVATRVLDELHSAKQATGLSFDQLWARYQLDAGPTAVGSSAFKGYFRGVSMPQVDHYEIIAHVINDRLDEIGSDHPRLGCRCRSGGRGTFDPTRTQSIDQVLRAADVEVSEVASLMGLDASDIAALTPLPIGVVGDAVIEATAEAAAERGFLRSWAKEDLLEALTEAKQSSGALQRRRRDLNPGSGLPRNSPRPLVAIITAPGGSLRDDLAAA